MRVDCWWIEMNGDEVQMRFDALRDVRARSAPGLVVVKTEKENPLPDTVSIT